jgi:UDP-glucose 4-epimerase
MNSVPYNLVTGGAGFIGSHVSKHLLRSGKHVLILDDLSGGFRENVPQGAEFMRGSVLDVSLLESIFERFDIHNVYHLAAYAAEGLSHFIRRFNYSNNVIGSVNLINLAVRNNVCCFVFTSSIAVYGKGQLPMTEDAVPKPEDPYGIAKYAVELDLKAAQEMFGLQYVIFRPHNVYGENQNIADPYRNVIGIFINQLMHGEAMTVFGDGTQTRAFTHIDDVAPIIAAAPETPEAINEVFNVGADTPYRVVELAHKVAKIFGVPPRIKFLPERNEVKHAFSDHSKVQAVFSPPPSVPLDKGLKRMIEWARKVGPRKRETFGPIEIRKGLPPSWAALIGDH